MMLTGKKVVVVGGSSGIGLSTAELAKREGADVIIASRNAERLDAVAAPSGAIAIPADVTSDESVDNLFRALRSGRSCRGHGGAAQDRSVQDGDDGRRARHHGRQVLGRLARRAIGRNPSRRIADAGLRLFEHSAAAQLRDRQRRQWRAGIAGAGARARTRAGARQRGSPGIIDTPIRAAMPEAARRDMLAKTAASLPVGRVGVGEDIARQILAFMTIGFATGSIVYLDGGALVT